MAYEQVTFTVPVVWHIKPLWVYPSSLLAIEVRPCTILCGNGNIDPGEDCDDRNNNNNDGCNSVCKWEYCGDGIIQPPEVCDDGNTLPGDGCDPDCKIEICGD